MPATLRNGKSLPPSPEKPAPAKRPKQDKMADSIERPSPYLLFVYPIILAVGSLFSVLSPTAFQPPAAPLAPGVTSDINTPKSHPGNYFAGKHNIVNLYFVKIGWFWLTLAFMLLQITTRPPTARTQKHYIQASLRYALVTLSWILTTQWFFGPALIDRSFTVTGGHCEPHLFNDGGLSQAMDVSMIASGPVCKARGGNWRGGHDISGHVFMLVLSSAFLLYELYIADRDSSHPNVSARAAAALAHDMTEEERKAVGGWESELTARIRVWSRYFIWGVVVLDFWMLLMTAIWFHTWSEKLSGLSIAASTLWGVFFLGDYLPQWKEIVGGL